MKEEAFNKKLQLTLGIILAAAFLLMTVFLYMKEAKLGIFLFVGLLFGYIVTRTRIGFSAIYVEFFNTGSAARFYYLLLLFVVSIVGTAVIHYLAFANGAVPQFKATGSQSVIPGTSSVVPVDAGVIVGAFLFGSGMVINKGCGSGTLRNMGKGNARYFLTFLFILIGTIPGQLLKHTFSQSSLSQYSVQLYLPDRFGYAGTVLLICVLLGFIAFLANGYAKKRRKEGEYDRKEKQDKVLNEDSDSAGSENTGIVHQLFRTKWPAWTGIVGVSLLLFLTLLTTGDTLKVTQPLIKPAVSLLESAGVSLNASAFSQQFNDLQNGLWRDAESVRNAGVLIGALLYSLTSEGFAFSWGIKWKESVWYILSGLMIGIGAILASGCNIGALYSGIVNFSLSGWAVLLFSTVGAILTMNVMNGKVTTINKVSS